MTQQTIEKIEKQIFDLTQELNALRREHRGDAVPDYTFRTLDGEVTLRALFGDRTQLLAIHNMGQGCRYCTLWADGFNPFVPHLETAMAVVLLSKDPPELQRRFANARGWRFRTASHAGGDYMREQVGAEGSPNMPGAVLYERDGDTIYRKNHCFFGPGDLYCSIWPLLALGGHDAESWTPQFSYWSRPETLDDGGANVRD